MKSLYRAKSGKRPPSGQHRPVPRPVVEAGFRRILTAPGCRASKTPARVQAVSKGSHFSRFLPTSAIGPQTSRRPRPGRRVLRGSPPTASPGCQGPRVYPPTARPLAPLAALRRRRAALRVPPLPDGPAPRCATGGGVSGGKTPGSVPTQTAHPMADWVGSCSAGRKARRPRAPRDVAGRRKGLFPSLELRIRPRQNSRRRPAGAPKRLPQGR